jgi:hypothetical protein
MRQAYKSFIVPAGKYWIGDPSAILSERSWKEFVRLTNETEKNREDYNSDNFESLGGYYETLCDDTKVLAFFTDKGKGYFEDQFGTEYDTVSGMIGLIPFDKCPCHEGIVMLEFNEETLCFCRDGILTFGMVVIDTL